MFTDVVRHTIFSKVEKNPYNTRGFESLNTAMFSHHSVLLIVSSVKLPEFLNMFFSNLLTTE